jgi:ABC-type dipeptide/oligopeptide/nickel transport system permease subunit
MFIGIIIILINLTKNIKIIKIILDNIFIFPEILYIFILLFLFSPINISKFIIILSIIRGYTFSNNLIREIGEIENKQFINALYSMGLKRFEIIKRHILPIITIPIAIFFLETIIWFIVIEFIITFINIIQIYKYPSIGTMINYFIQTNNYNNLYIIIVIMYLFIFELSYIINNIKLKFEVLFKKEI